MNVNVVCVGTELLLGDIVNSNAATIGRSLAAIGAQSFLHLAVGDNEDRIARALAIALDEADAVVVSGGLGPTQDDITREAVAALVGEPLIPDGRMEEAIRARFAFLRRPMPEINLRQALRPENAVPIEPVMGTAPGLIVPHGEKTLYLVPGVPSELEEMMERAVLPDIASRSGTAGAIVARVVRVVGLAESAMAETLAPVWTELEASSVRMAFLAGGGEVRVRLTALAADRESAKVSLDQAESMVRARLGTAVVGTDRETLELAVLARLAEQGLTVAFAESFTGGGIAARITDVAGASKSVRGGVVAYSNEAKIGLLGVPAGIIEAAGAVSAPCAAAMAAGARERFGAGVGLSTTGVAGPEDPEGKGVGTVFVAVSGPFGDAVRELRLPGGRDLIRRMGATAALNLLRLYLSGAAS